MDFNGVILPVLIIEAGLNGIYICAVDEYPQNVDINVLIANAVCKSRNNVDAFKSVKQLYEGDLSCLRMLHGLILDCGSLDLLVSGDPLSQHLFELFEIDRL